MGNPVPIDLPAGVYKNGTEYSAKGRWADASLVRWKDGALRPIGGWLRRKVKSTGVDMAVIISSPSTDTVRDTFSWNANNGDEATVLGSNAKVYHMNQDNAIADITPAGFSGGLNDPATVTGYGAGLYGTETYGTERSAAGVTVTPVPRWMFDAWGEDCILATTGGDGKVYDYTPGDAAAVVITNAPTDVIGMVVTDERFLMVIGSAVDARKVSWCDKEDNTLWAPAVVNEAGSQVLAGAGNLLAIRKVLDDVLILSSTDAHLGKYLGPPYVWGFKRIGNNCGIISAMALATTDKFAFWVGERQFWMYDGDVRPLECEVMDFFFHDRHSMMNSKIVATTISQFNEIWWLYQSKTGSEVDSYIAYNYNSAHWSIGRLDRTSHGDAGTLDAPVMMDKDGFLYTHEQHGVIVTGAFAESGPLELKNGANNIAIRFILPDTIQNGDVTITFKGRDMPNGAEYTYGPYTLANPTPTRAIGRQLSMRVEATGARADWEFGSTRLDISTVGGFR